MSEAWIVWDDDLPVEVRRTEDLAREAAHGYLRSNWGHGLVCIQGPIAGPQQTSTNPAVVALMDSPDPPRT